MAAKQGFKEEPIYTEVNPGANAELRCVIENIGGECRWQKDGKVSTCNIAFVLGGRVSKARWPRWSLGVLAL